MIKNSLKFGKLTAILLTTLLLSQGCIATYRSIKPNLVCFVKPIKKDETIEKLIDKPTEKIDYSKLTWQETVKYVQMLEQAQDYLDRHFSFASNWDSGFYIPGLFSVYEKGETFKYNHTKRKGVCFDYATVAAALLHDNNYPPLILVMKESILRGHAMFLYRTEKGFGTLGNTPMKPKYSTINDLVKDFQNQYGRKYYKYAVFNLDHHFKNKEWISGNINLYYRTPFFSGYTYVK